jgi:hypothetical protein
LLIRSLLVGPLVHELDELESKLEVLLGALRVHLGDA